MTTFLEWLHIVLLTIATMMMIPMLLAMIPWSRKWFAWIDAKRLAGWQPGRPTWRGRHRQHLTTMMYGYTIPAMRAWCEEHMPGRFRYRKEVYDERVDSPWCEPFIEFRTREDLIHFRLMWSEHLSGLPAGAYPLPLVHVLLSHRAFWLFQATLWSANGLHAYLRPEDELFFNGIARWLGVV